MTPPSVRSSEQTILANRYRLLALLGVGGMGSVYRALDAELDEHVALKVLRRELVGMPGILERFRREVKLARRVTHPNVARTFDIGEHAGERFLTMELVEGESLGDLLSRETRLRVERVVEIAVAVCQGLAAAHGAGVVHRDLKPDNVLLGRDGRVVITDFGIARACLDGAGPTRTSGLAIGTPEYMAPEQVEASANIDHRADIYALGVMLYEMLIGERPWGGDSPFGVAAARLIKPPPDPREKAEIPDSLARVVLRCLARDPRARYATASEVSSALSGMTLPAGLVVVKAPSLPPPAALRVRRTGVVVRPFVTKESGRASSTGPLTALDGLSDLCASLLARASGLTARVANEAGDAHVVVDGALHDDVLVVSVVNTDDALPLTRLRVSDALVDPFGAATKIADAVARALAANVAPLPAPPPARRDVVELLLRARAEARRPEASANDRVIARWERAIHLAPDDPWVNGGYALSLARRFVVSETAVDEALEARGMAERAAAAAPQMVDAIVALATLDREDQNLVACAAHVRRALMLDRSRAELHHLHGSLLAETDDDGAIDALARARAHDELRWRARWDEAMVRVLGGDANEAERLLVAVTPEEEQSDGYWFARARVALIAGELHRANEVRRAASRRFFERRELLLAVLDAAARGRVADGELALLRHHRELSAGVPRRAARYRMLEAELLAFVGDFHGAAAAVRAAVDLGLADLRWIERAPILEPLRTRSVFLQARDVVCARAARVQSALHESVVTLDFPESPRT